MSTQPHYGTREHTVGRPPCDDRAAYYALRFGIKRRAIMRHWTWQFLDQLDACKSDGARRLLLGVGEKGETGYAADIRMAFDFSYREAIRRVPVSIQ